MPRTCGPSGSDRSKSCFSNRASTRPSESSPTEDEIEFFFELVPGGGLTPLLYKLPAGETLLMRRQAKGLFTLDAKSGHTRHYLVSTVTGVAPYVSMARTLAQEAEA